MSKWGVEYKPRAGNTWTLCGDRSYADESVVKALCEAWNRQDSLNEHRAVLLPEGGRKDDDGKMRFDLFPARVHLEIVKSLTYGGKRYGDENWKKVSRRRYVAAFFRHVNKWLLGEQVDPDQQCHHLACACANLIFLIARDVGFDPDLSD